MRFTQVKIKPSQAPTGILQAKTLSEEITVLKRLGESQPWMSDEVIFHSHFLLFSREEKQKEK